MALGVLSTSNEPAPGGDVCWGNGEAGIRPRCRAEAQRGYSHRRAFIALLFASFLCAGKKLSAKQEGAQPARPRTSPGDGGFGVMHLAP